MTRIAGIAFGCSTNLRNNPAGIVECVESLPAELKMIEIEIEEEFRAVLAKSDEADRQRLADSLLELSDRQGRQYAIHAPWYGREISLCTPDYREIARAAMLLAIDLSERVRSPIVTFHPGLAEGATERQILDNLFLALDPLTKVAADAGIKLCMETMGGRSSAHCLLSHDAHVEAWEQLGIMTCLDVPHIASRVASAAELESYIAESIQFIGHIHLADTRIGVHRHLPLGLGDIDFMALLRRLSAGGYRGAAVVEEWNKGHPSDTYIAHAAQFVALHGD